MEKIINGKRYSTDTATKIANYWNGLSDNDFKHFEETLYQKKTGEFFLQGQGGPMSHYAYSVGDNTTTGGSKFIPLDIDEAKAWVEEHANKRYVEIFGEVEE